MKRVQLVLAAALVAGGFNLSTTFAADDGMSTGDSTRNKVDQAGAGTPTASNPAPDAKDIRKTIGEMTTEAVTKGDLNHIVNRFVDADRNRIKNSPTYGDDYGEKLDGRIEQISQAWKSKYGHDFDINKNVNDTLGDQFASIQQGVIGNSADAELAKCVEKNSSHANMTDQKDNNGNTKGDENLENGRSIAVATVKGMHGMSDMQVPLIHELPDSWKINVPDSVNADKLRQNLLDHLTAVGERTTEWPLSEDEAYRMVSYHVLMAVLDEPMKTNAK